MCYYSLSAGVFLMSFKQGVSNSGIYFWWAWYCVIVLLNAMWRRFQSFPCCMLVGKANQTLVPWIITAPMSIRLLIPSSDVQKRSSKSRASKLFIGIKGVCYAGIEWKDSQDFKCPFPGFHCRFNLMIYSYKTWWTQLKIHDVRLWTSYRHKCSFSHCMQLQTNWGTELRHDKPSIV